MPRQRPSPNPTVRFMTAGWVPGSMPGTSARVMRLHLRVLSRQEQPASKVLNPTQRKVLRASSKKELPAQLSVRDAMLAVAKPGGHLECNGDLGWITLGRGYERLLAYEEGWKLARSGNSRRRSDQS